MQGELWVGLVGKIIIVRARGLTTVGAVLERHARILEIAKDSGIKNVLFDFLEAEAPPFEANEIQKALNVELKALGFRLAVVVANSRLALISRTVFSDDNNHRIVYEDLAEAALWLSGHDERTFMDNPCHLGTPAAATQP